MAACMSGFYLFDMYRFAVLLLLGASPLAAAAQASLSVTPAYAYITEREPHGSFVLRNEGSSSVEVLARAHYGVIAADSAGQITRVALGEAGAMGDLARRLTFFPERLILEPGDERFVRYLVRDVQTLRPGASVALMHYEMLERAALPEDQIPAVATALSVVYSLVAPLVLIKGRGAPQLDARALSLEDSTLTLLMANTSAFPFVGGVSLYSEEARLGRVEAAVYTLRRLEIPLEELPRGSPLHLRFDPSYTGLPAGAKSRMLVPAPIAISL